MHRYLLALMLVICGNPAFAQVEGLVGKWAVRADGQTVMMIEISQSEGKLAATLLTPQKGYINQSHAAVDMSGPMKATQIIEVRRTANSAEFAPKADPNDVNVLTLIEPGLMTFGYKRAPSFEPVLFTRARQGESVSIDWSAQTDWMLDERWPDNANVKRLFDEDQAIRTSGSKIDWELARVEDANRRDAVQKLLDEGKLRSGNDFYHAAFIFQHGHEPEDFLKAHGLAVIATAKGRRDATWIAAATLDRYLQNIGQKQIYGTQYRIPENETATQEPYDRTLLSDAMRAASGVPDTASQEERRKEMDAKRANSASPSK
jgi:hypothetical protein